MMKKIARVGDTSNHGGKIITGIKTVLVEGKPVAVENSIHSCPQSYPGGAPHGNTPIKAITKTVYVAGKLILTENAIAGCGALIKSLAKFSVAE